MRYIWQHIEEIIKTYDGSLPLSHFLRKYYKQFPKLGSRDRKMLSEMTYSWYRCGKAISKDLTVDEQITTAIKLCNTDNQHLLRLTADIQVNTSDVNMNKTFRNDVPLSDGINRDEWLNSMTTQPMLFIRLRKNAEQLIEIIEQHGVAYKHITDTCIALPNGTKIDQWLPEFAYVVQDASSQQTGSFFNPQPYEQWWDCCSGAGGKSLLLKDIEPLIDITASDTRKTILENLKDRFRTYSHILPTVYQADVSKLDEIKDIMPNKQFDHIVCDVPCTGSGTWARTPEQMYFFNTKDISNFAARQKDILNNAATFLKPNGSLFYITCSVFKEENEDVVATLLQDKGFQLEQSVTINGIEKNADSMYIAVITKKA